MLIQPAPPQDLFCLRIARTVGRMCHGRYLPLRILDSSAALPVETTAWHAWPNASNWIEFHRPCVLA